MPGRSFSSGSYRYGFQGQEKDDEIKGAGNSINYKYRVHDPRLGRFLSFDPLAPDYPWNSPYAFSENQMIDAVELEGLEKYELRFLDPNLENATEQQLSDFRKTASIPGFIAFGALGGAVAANFFLPYVISGTILYSNSPTGQYATAELVSFAANLFCECPIDPIPTSGPGGELGKALRGTSKIFKKSLIKLLSKSPKIKVGKNIISKLEGSVDDAYKQFKKLVGDSKITSTINNAGKKVNIATLEDGTTVTLREFSITQKEANAVIEINNKAAKSAKKGKSIKIKFFDKVEEYGDF
jgi:RHS repeat-associated protein